MIRGIQKTTLIDYPGKIACTLFTAGCNFRCGYCYNKDIVCDPKSVPKISEKEILDFLENKKKYLDGVCITGGEPTLFRDKLVEFIRKVKEMGYLVKLDSNGTNPDIIRQLIEEKLIDYVAMDIKASPKKYEDVTYVKVKHEHIKESIKMIMDSGLDYEFRTTLVPDIIDEEAIRDIGKLLNGAKRFYLQQFRAQPTTIDKKYTDMEPLSMKKIESYKEILSNHIDKVGIRT